MDADSSVTLDALLLYVPIAAAIAATLFVLILGAVCVRELVKGDEP